MGLRRRDGSGRKCCSVLKALRVGEHEQRMGVFAVIGGDGSLDDFGFV